MCYTSFLWQCGGIQHCVRVLKPSGRLVFVVNNTTVRLKYYFTFLQELIVVKLLGLTKGEGLRFQSLDECKTWIIKAGGAVITINSLDRWRPYSHAAVVAIKLPGAESSASIGQTL